MPQLLLLDDALVVGKEFAFQNRKPIEFREQVRGGQHGVRDRIVGHADDTLVERGIGPRKVEVVEPREGGVNLIRLFIGCARTGES